MLEWLITVCVFMSFVRRAGLDLQLLANFLPCVRPCEGPDHHNRPALTVLGFSNIRHLAPQKDIFGTHKCHMSEEHGSIAMTEAQCESQHEDNVFSPCLPSIPTARTSRG